MTPEILMMSAVAGSMALCAVALGADALWAKLRPGQHPPAWLQPLIMVAGVLYVVFSIVALSSAAQERRRGDDEPPSPFPMKPASDKHNRDISEVIEAAEADADNIREHFRDAGAADVDRHGAILFDPEAR